MKALKITLLTALLFGSASSALASSPSADLQAKILSYGIWKDLDSIQASNRAVILDSFNGLGLLEKTKTIPMKLGNIFIFRFEITGKDGNYKTEMVQWHPEFANGKIVSERTSQSSEFEVKNGKYVGYWGHSLSEPSNLVPGEWGYEVRHNGKTLLSFKFTTK